jgi:hypothetical protein
LFLTSDGSLWGMGLHADGQLGNGIAVSANANLFFLATRINMNIPISATPNTGFAPLVV